MRPKFLRVTILISEMYPYTSYSKTSSEYDIFLEISYFAKLLRGYFVTTLSAAGRLVDRRPLPRRPWDRRPPCLVGRQGDGRLRPFPGGRLSGVLCYLKNREESPLLVPVLRIGDVYPGSQFFSIPDPNSFHVGSRIRIKEFKYFNLKNCF
jgi:hypothetical protein